MNESMDQKTFGDISLSKLVNDSVTLERMVRRAFCAMRYELARKSCEVPPRLLAHAVRRSLLSLAGLNSANTDHDGLTGYMNDTTCAIYDFCLDWQMSGDSADRAKLITSFKSLGISYEEFEKYARAWNWYVSSMTALRMIDGQES